MQKLNSKIRKNLKQENYGITLMVLVITIIVLLILAGISISMLTGDNGLIKNAGTAKEQAEISNEKEVLNTASLQAMSKNKYRNLTETELKQSLENIVGENKTEVTTDGDNLVVHFKESNRYYQLDNEGNIQDFIIYTDTTPGELAGTGTEDDPFKIECIEDLVVFSIMTNGGNTDLGIKSNNFLNQYITLERTLDFNSIFSYDNDTTTRYGDLNTDGVIEDIKTELTKEDDGCIGFTSITSFRGTFDGQENELRNIYQNRAENVGIFASTNGATIKNLIVSGYIKSNNYWSAGICSYGSNTTIINCINRATIVQSGKIASENPKCGGIAGELSNGIIIDCHNEGTVAGDARTGGIVGSISGKVINSYNLGNVTGNLGANYGAAGGIVGILQNGGIYNCFNTGKVVSWNTSNGGYATAGGILGNSGQVGSTVTVANVYNIGEVCKEGYCRAYGAIVGGLWYDASNICITKNSYFQGDSVITGYGNIAGDVEGITECTKEFMYSNELVTKLNAYIENNQDEIDTSEWRKWKLGENGYPIFE